MRLKAPAITTITLAISISAYYAVEPWAVTFVDDGPYYSTRFPGPIGELPILSSVELRRFGHLFYTLESRLLTEGEESVLVLSDSAGKVKWIRLPVKPDGELGSLELLRVHATWYGGWRVAIRPANQESGNLYLGIFGGFRFFNHSW